MKDRLKDWRVRLDLTQEQAAALIGCDRTAYSRYEQGIRIPRLPRAYKIAEVFGCDLKEIAEFAPAMGKVIKMCHAF